MYSPYTEEISFFQNEEPNNYSDPVMVKVIQCFRDMFQRDSIMHSQAGYNRIAMGGGDLWRSSNPTPCQGSIP